MVGIAPVVNNPIHSIGNSLKKQKPLTIKYITTSIQNPLSLWVICGLIQAL